MLRQTRTPILNRLLRQRTVDTSTTCPVHPKLLFTPGPLVTSTSVKSSMLVDYGSRDTFFMETVQKIRQGVVDIADIPASEKGEWTCVPLPGSGTMGVEAAISTSAPPLASNNGNPCGSNKGNKALVVCNGAYGYRHTNICRRIGAFEQVETFEWAEGELIDTVKFAEAVADPKLKGLNTFVVVHHETSTGIMNPVQEMVDIVRREHPSATVIVDAMSSFGGIPIQVSSKFCDILVSSANKCIQGVPGFSISLARKDRLAQWRNNSRSFTLDLSMQNDALDKTGQFPFTPPTHTVVAFRRALDEHNMEGGTEARYKRYKSNSDFVMDKMLELGFQLFVKDRNAPQLGPFIVSFDYPDTAKTGWEFKKFYDALSKRDCVIYPGKASKADTFRIGCIGDLHREDFEKLIREVKAVLAELKVKL